MAPPKKPTQTQLARPRAGPVGYTEIPELQHSPFLPFPAPGCLEDGMYFMETTSSPLYWWRPAASAPICKEARLIKHC